jgi:hypothetical protein
MGGACSADGREERRVKVFLGGKPDGKRLLGRPRNIWAYNIRRIFRKWDVGVWTGMSWLRIDRWRAHKMRGFS